MVRILICYDDADDAINQLSWEPRAIIGLSYWFGGQAGQAGQAGQN